MKALADQVRGFVKNASDEAVVAFAHSAGIIGLVHGHTMVAADAPPGGGRRPAPRRKAVPRAAASSSHADDVVGHVRANVGQRIGEIVKGTGLDKATVAKILKAERGKRIEQQGDRGATRYYPIEAD